MREKLISKWAFDVSTNPPLFCAHEFFDNEKTIVHTIGGEVRAEVPKGHIAEYLTIPAVAQALTTEEQFAIIDKCAEHIAAMLKEAGENPNV